MTDPLTLGIPIAARAVGPLASRLGRVISGNEEKLIRRSFLKAIRKVREEKRLGEPDAPEDLSRLAKIGKGVKKGRSRVSQRFTHDGKKELKSDRRVAAWLARTWANRSQTSTGNAPAEVCGRSHDWLTDLAQFLETVALEGSGTGRQTTPTSCKSERDEARKIWLDVLGGKLTTEQVGAWANQVAVLVAMTWRANERLHGLISQLNHDSRQGLMEAIAFAVQDGARSLRRLIAGTLPAALIGGGGVALLVLFVDKG